MKHRIIQVILHFWNYFFQNYYKSYTSLHFPASSTLSEHNVQWVKKHQYYCALWKILPFLNNDRMVAAPSNRCVLAMQHQMAVSNVRDTRYLIILIDTQLGSLMQIERVDCGDNLLRTAEGIYLTISAQFRAHHLQRKLVFY